MCRVKHRRGVEELSAAESSQGRRNLGGRFAASSWSAPSICVSAGCPNQRRPGPSVTPTANRLGLSLKLGNAAVGDTTPPAPGIRLSVSEKRRVEVRRAWMERMKIAREGENMKEDEASSHLSMATITGLSSQRVNRWNEIKCEMERERRRRAIESGGEWWEGGGGGD